MGVSSSKVLIRTEALEPREFLSVAPAGFSMVSVASLSAGSVDGGQPFAPIYIQNDAGTIHWDLFTISNSSANGFSLGASQSGDVDSTAVARAANRPGGNAMFASATTVSGVTMQAVAAVQRPSTSDNESDREAYLASLTAANSTEIVTAPSLPEGVTQTNGSDNDNTGKVTRGHRGGRGIGPGILHPGQGEGGGSGSAGNSAGSGDGSGSGSSHAASSEALLSVVPIGPAATQTADLASNTAPVRGDPVAIPPTGSDQIVAAAQATITDAPRMAESMAQVTFSVLPLAIAEIQASATLPNAPMSDASQQSLAQQFVSHARAATAAIKAVEEIVTSDAIPARTALVNLFHVDALATFSDAMGAFIDESAASVTPMRLTPVHSRAWKITAGVAVADVILVAGWLTTRRRDQSKVKAAAATTPGFFCLPTAFSPG
jgi:hypothetical protein